jgi:peptidyl-prolyl cis-trans isomerase C
VRRFVLAGLTVLAACTRAPAPSPSVAPMVAASDDDVVATVDGRPIFARDVARQMRARGVDRRAALEDLVRAEALAGEAARRGLDQDLDVQLETKGALVRRYLQTTFEREVTPADVPAELVRKAYNRNQPYLNHDTYIDVWHLLVAVDEKAPPELKQQARALALEVAARARTVHSLDEFKALKHAFTWQGRPLALDEVITERDGWTQRSFSYAAFDQLHKPGDTSSVVETTFGYHVLYLVGFKPPEHVPIADAEPRLRLGLFPQVQKQKFDELLEEITPHHQLELHPERLPK